jgi:hypothetical protein
MTTTSSKSLLYTARGARGFGGGSAIIILPTYLTATIGYAPLQIGIVVPTLTLWVC